MRVLRNSVLSLILQIAQAAAGFGTMVLVTRAMGPAGIGAYTLLGLVTTAALLFTNLGLSSAAVYHVGKNSYPLRDIVGTSASISFAFFASSGGRWNQCESIILLVTAPGAMVLT